ncbi:MAG: DUF5916 domain-containing protein [Bacteroidales bacterium]|jgi:hypothetical protein|nr:DUF5916 domain-containing protein [Bacteroidales bacterium]
MNKFCLTALMIFLLVSIPGINNAYSQERREYRAVRISGSAPAIDGRADEPAWEEAEWQGGFIQQRPFDGKPASQLTEFRIIYDDEAIYALIRAFDTEPEKVEKRLTRRDETEGDVVALQFDSYFDRRTAYSFMVNAAGVKKDYIISNDGDDDKTWDPVWFVKTSTDSLGWLAEMKIPLTQLRFAKAEDYLWGMQVGRILYRLDELSLWQPIPADAPGWVSHYGNMTGMTNIVPKREVELLPYIMGNMENYPEETGNPYAEGRDFGFNAGVDGKIAITNDLTMNFTINPDFGQVEADPSVVNLTAFETFYPEQRPFFIEGNNIYSFKLTGGNGSMGRDNLFYSRRIGRTPHYCPEITDDEYLKMPRNSTILGAFKLSGKTRDGWSVGIMESVTQQESALKYSGGKETRITAEPLTSYFNTRVQKDFSQGETILGGMVTATNRFINDSALDFINYSAYTGGLDFTKYWKDRTYYVAVNGAFSHLTGKSEAITEIQSSPVHYFQRSDNDHRDLDSGRTSLTGTGGAFEIGKQGNGHWQYMARFVWRSPGLELNDMGYLRQGDIIQEVLWANYRIWEPFGIFRSMNISGDHYTGWDYGGNYVYQGIECNSNFEFKNYWSFSPGFEIGFNSVDRYNLRGGPAIKNPGGASLWGFLETDPRKKLTTGAGIVYHKANYDNARILRLELALTYKPVNSLQISLSPFWETGHDRLQYVETLESNSENRYIMARIDNQILSANLRINLSITPDLTIQYWGQPFVFAGNYSEFKRDASTRADYYYDRFHIYPEDEIFFNEADNEYTVTESGSTLSFSNPDFKVFEFRSNLVVRWEYIPGSAAYLVWSQGRIGDDISGESEFGPDIDRLFSIEPHNVFLLKLTYRISI